jgi:hypothetical protein
MAVQKPVRFIYQSRNSKTGLGDVKAQVYLNGAAKATGASAIAATELGFGVYEVVLTAANLTSWGVSATQYNALEVIIDSATSPAQAIFRAELTVSNNDEIEAHLVSQDTAIAAVKSDTAAIKADLETGSSSLSVINTKIDKILNNSGFALSVPDELLRPASGSNSYRISQTFYDDQNEGLVDVDGQAITVTVTNQAGADRSQYLTGYVAGTSGANGSAPAVRESLGQYHVDLAIPSTAAQEQLNFTFAYAIRGQATARKATSNVLTDVQAQGFALQATSLDIQTKVTDIQSKVNDSTIGLQAANVLQTAIKTQTDKLGDATIGLAAIKTAVTAVQTEVVSNVEGAGFISAQDSLHAISQYLQTSLFSGGKAV